MGKKTEKIDPAEKFAGIKTVWDPHIAALFNGQQLKLVRLSGPGDWLCHPAHDLLVMAFRGEFILQFRGRNLGLSAGELAVVPRGTPYRTIAISAAEVLLIDPQGETTAANLNTGARRFKLKKI